MQNDSGDRISLISCCWCLFCNGGRNGFCACFCELFPNYFDRPPPFSLRCLFFPFILASSRSSRFFVFLEALSSFLGIVIRSCGDSAGTFCMSERTKPFAFSLGKPLILSFLCDRGYSSSGHGGSGGDDGGNRSRS